MYATCVSCPTPNLLKTATAESRKDQAEWAIRDNCLALSLKRELADTLQIMSTHPTRTHPKTVRRRRYTRDIAILVDRIC